MRVYVHACVSGCGCLCLCVYVCACVCMCVCACLNVCLCMSVYVCQYVCVCVQYRCVCVSVPVYVHMHRNHSDRGSVLFLTGLRVYVCIFNFIISVCLVTVIGPLAATLAVLNGRIFLINQMFWPI